MIHIKIYDKGRDETHIHARCRYPRDRQSSQLGALLVATCRIARDGLSGLDKDTFLQMMGCAWDAEAKRSESET